MNLNALSPRSVHVNSMTSHSGISLFSVQWNTSPCWQLNITVRGQRGHSKRTSFSWESRSTRVSQRLRKQEFSSQRLDYIPLAYEELYIAASGLTESSVVCFRSKFTGQYFAIPKTCQFMPAKCVASSMLDVLSTKKRHCFVVYLWYQVLYRFFTP